MRDRRGEGRRRIDSSFAVGSNGQKRLGLKAEGEQSGVGYVVSASRYLTDGWRAQSAADKNMFNARLDTNPGDSGQLMLVANYVDVDALDPGGVTPADWQRSGLAAGTPFALAHTFGQTGPFRPRNVDRRVPGLVFAGSGTTPGVGIPMVLISGKLAAQRVQEVLR